MDLEFHPEAIEEAIATINWYQDRVESVARAFEQELNRALEAIAQAPERWPAQGSKQLRRYLLRRFPYSVWYRLEAGRIVIYAVAHGRRRPGYWRGRAEDT